MKMSKTATAAVVLTVVVATGAPLFYSSSVTAEVQPKMSGALLDLQAAKRKLERASTDKGGHRKIALALVRDAIAEVKKGMKYDNRH